VSKASAAGAAAEETSAEDASEEAGAAPQAARLAKQEYPNLPNEYAIHVYRDDTMGMWKVTIETEVAVQSEYEFRDVYLSDSGVTQLLVYEGPLRFDESRK